MREYDDHIRLYTPIFQRIIILVAVIVAVPVMLWTITAFVRTYVGPAKAPTYQRMAIATPADGAASASDATAMPAAVTSQSQPAAAPAPPAEAKATTADTRIPVLTIKKPPAAEPPQDSNASPAPAVTQVAAPQIAIPQVAVATAAPAPMQDLADKSDRIATPAAVTWPTPPPMPPSPDTAANGAAADDADALPATAPLTGRVPLPRTRPTLYAMAQPTTVPLPRARPASAPAPMAAETTSDAASGYNPGLGGR